MKFFERKFPIFLAASVMVGIYSTNAALAQSCNDPQYQALRNRLSEQLRGKIQELASTGDCSLIPGIVAFQQRANSEIESAAARSRCGSRIPGKTASELEANLRQACRLAGETRRQQQES